MAFFTYQGRDKQGRAVSGQLEAASELVAAERRASQEWLHRRLAGLNADERATLLRAADLMSAIVDESA